METHALTSALLQELRAPQPYPVVSLSMPTHRREPDNAQDGVRLRNLVAEAVHRLEADEDVPRKVRIDLKEQLDRAVSDLDLRHAQDGLVIFVRPGEHQLWSLPRTVPERIVLSDTYLTRNLVAAKAQARPYWVLAVAADRATLWDGSVEALREHTADGFPQEPEEIQTDPQREERQGDTPSTFRDETTRQYLRGVDAALAAVLAAHPRPLYLVGLAPAVGGLEEAGSVARTAAGKLLKGGFTNGPAQELHTQLRPTVEEFERASAERVAKRLDEARGRRTFAAGLDEVWEAVREGRAALVAVEDNYQQTVRLQDGHLAPVGPGDEKSAGHEVREDIVDELVEAALDSGAEVVFLPDDALAAHDRIAADLRY
ncbi:baeRF3 domain-containing protein [Streptomyces beijiangensis]|uniref:Chemotaxis protein n=1 Tax=Streptomyces beijiangensis TaxID=163361 RepID=A0A939JJQ9_9ACTN|nr:chemotaxis protein [Streptomyces beijiangensis]MBO0514520.1 chemotaxis protein [Streptomyces beijiangensis]